MKTREAKASLKGRGQSYDQTFKALVENRQKSKKDAGRFSSKHKIESMGREGENLAEQSDGIIEKMDELGTVMSKLDIVTSKFIQKRSMRQHMKHLWAS